MLDTETAMAEGRLLFYTVQAILIHKYVYWVNCRKFNRFDSLSFVMSKAVILNFC